MLGPFRIRDFIIESLKLSAIIVTGLFLFSMTHTILVRHNLTYQNKVRTAVFMARITEDIDDTSFDHDPSWKTVQYDPHLKMPEKNADDWSYPWYMIKHVDGHFENTMSDTIQAEDTLRLYHNAHCYTYDDQTATNAKNYRSRLPFAEAKRSEDTLKLKIHDFSASNYELLHLNIYGGKYKMTYRTSYVYLYQDIEFDYLNSALVLQKRPPYQPGDTLKGALTLELNETIIFEDGKSNPPSSRLIKGTFEVEVE